MNTTINLILDTRRQRKDKTYPIVFRIVFNRKPTSIKTDFAVLAEDWDSSKSKIKKRCKKYNNIENINNNLHLDLTEYNRKLLVREDEFDSIYDVKDYLLGKVAESKTTFGGYTLNLINEFKNEGRIGNAKAYSNTLMFTRKYFKKDFDFKDLTPKKIKKIEVYYLACGYTFNGLAFNLRTIRAIYNRAIAEKIIPPSVYPFRRNSYEKDKYAIKSEKTRKRAISKDDIQLIESYKAPIGTMKYDAVNYFLFSFYCRGINFIDMAFLKVDNINGEYIFYQRQKTHKQYKIKITGKARDILNLYGLEKKKTKDYLFPIIKRNGPELIRKDIENGNRNANNNLKKVAKELGIATNLTMYVSRHTWATVADKIGIDRRIISQGLGHSSLATTEIYINDIVSTEDLDMADELIIG